MATVTVDEANHRSSINITFDLALIFESNKTEDHITITLPAIEQDLVPRFTVYPKGNTNDDNTSDDVGDVAGYMYLSIQNPSKYKNRLIGAKIQCGDETMTIGTKKVCQYTDKTGWGKTKMFRNDHVMQYKLVTIDVYLDKEFSAWPQIRSNHADQLKSLYKLATKFGDIKLIPMKSPDIGNDKKQDISGIDDDKQDVIDISDNKIQDICGIDDNDEQDVIKIQSSILMSASTVFKQMLTNNMKEFKDKSITIPYNRETIDTMVYFIITGHLRHDILVFDLIKLAHCYQLTNLYYACLDRLVHTLNADNFVKAVKVFDEYNDRKDIVKKLYMKLLNYFHKNKTTLIQQINVNDLPFCFVEWSEYMDRCINK